MPIRAKSFFAIFAIIIWSFISCVKDSSYFDRIWVYQPNLPSAKPVLEVVVMEWTPPGSYDAFINRCKVKLYKSKADYEQNINATDSGYSNVKGSVAFIVDSTNYWIRCEKDCQSNDLFNALASSPMSRYQRNREIVWITGSSKIELRNTTSLSYYISAVYISTIYGETSEYLDLLHPNEVLEVTVPTPAKQILAEPELLNGPNKVYPISQTCGTKASIDVR